MAIALRVSLVVRTLELKLHGKAQQSINTAVLVSAWVLCFYNLLARSLNLLIYVFACLSLLWKYSNRKNLILMMLAGVTG